MCNKWYLIIVACTLLFTSCSQTSDTMETTTIVPSATTTTQPTATKILTVVPSPTSQPTPTPELKPTTVQTLPSADTSQINLFGLVPPDFLGVGYCNTGLIRKDSDLQSTLESTQIVCTFEDSQILGSSVDRTISFTNVPKDSTRVSMGIVYILQGDFEEITLPELVQEIELEDSVLQDYQGFELMVEEQEESNNFAVMILDEFTVIFGEETGVKDVIDTALGLKSSQVADLGAALPQVFWASVFNNCPQYENLGCTAMVVPGLAQGASSDISLLHVYEFEDPDLAAAALDVIQKNAESGNLTQTGSIKISGDIITQEGRFILLEDLISIDELGDVFE